MNQSTRCGLLAGLAAFLVGPTCPGGVDFTPAKAARIQNEVMAAELRPVMIVSKPIGARVKINGRYVGNTPLLVDFAVDKFGRSVRDIEIRAVAQRPGTLHEVRRFPAANPADVDGPASFVPSLINFDLYIVPVYVIRRENL